MLEALAVRVLTQIAQDPKIIGKLLEQLGSMPNVPTKTMGGPIFWNDVACIGGWKLQQNRVFGNCRILDPNNIRRAWGGETAIQEAFQSLEGSIDSVPSVISAMPLLSNEIGNTIETIDRLVNPSSERFGRLLNWQNPPDPFHHYGIGLSDVHIFDTGQGLCAFERSDAQFVIGVEGIAFEPKQTIQRLKHALQVFSSWDYTLTGWNCEHLARLIATDQPRCYQSSPLWWLCNMSPEGDHKTAQKIFRDYLIGVDPSLAR